MTSFELDISKFRAIYTGLTECAISDESLENLWCVIVTQLGDGKGNFPYPAPANQAILYAALCHLATLQTDGLNQPARIASAGEGSVSTSFENLQVRSEQGQWWNLTKCGALFWVLTQKYRVGCRFYAGNHYHPWG